MTMFVGNEKRTKSLHFLLNFLHLISKSSHLKVLFSCVVFFSIYFVYVSYLIVAESSTCLVNRRWKADLLKKAESLRAFENDILLEYRTFREVCNNSEWKGSDCHNGSCTRVIVERERSADIRASSNNSIANTSALQQKRRGLFKEDTINAKPRKSILFCDDLDKFWDDPEFAAFTSVSQTKETIGSGIVVRRGVVSAQFFEPNIVEVVTKEAHKNVGGYSILREEHDKRRQLGWNFNGLPLLLGACSTPSYIRLLLKHDDGIDICDETAEEAKKFTRSSCFFLSNLHRFIRKQNDTSKSALTFLKNMICFIGELEKRKVFIEDLHGNQFTIQNDMSITLKNLDNLLFYGSRNIYSNNICLESEDCAKPSGAKWQNDTTNYIIYQYCNDIKPRCWENRCVGFGTSVHLCGVANWMIKKMFVHMKREQDKHRMLRFYNMMALQYAESRKSGEYLCNQMTKVITKYEKELEVQGKGIFAFHLGLPPVKQKET